MRCKTKYVFNEIKILVSNRSCGIEKKSRNFENKNRVLNNNSEFLVGDKRASEELLETAVDQEEIILLNEDSEDNRLLKEPLQDICVEDEDVIIIEDDLKETHLNETEEMTDPDCNAQDMSNIPIMVRVDIPDDFNLDKNVDKVMFIPYNVSLSNQTTDQYNLQEQSLADEQVPLECSKCGEYFTTKLLFDLHNKQHEDNPKYDCTMCFKTFFSVELLQEHIAKFHWKMTLSRYICSFCGKRYRNKGGLEYHLATNHFSLAIRTNNLNCRMRIMHKDAAQLNKYHRILDEVKKRTLCFVCKKHFSTIQDLENHVKTHPKETAHMCSKCGRGFKFSHHLKRHMYIHTTERPLFSCANCENQYTTKFSLKAHMVTHENKLLYACTKCTESFWKKPQLQYHIWKCHAESSMVAHQLQQEDSESTNNDAEERRLNNCDEIEIVEDSIKAELSEEVNLKYRQILRETMCKDENKLKANEVRGFGFDLSKEKKKQDSLDVENCDEIEIVENPTIAGLNMNTHCERDKPRYSCSNCEKQFTDTNSLKVHLCKHYHNNVPYHCNRCNKTFVKKYHLEAHILKIHNELGPATQTSHQEVEMSNKETSNSQDEVEILDYSLDKSGKTIKEQHEKCLAKEGALFECSYQEKEFRDEVNLTTNEVNDDNLIMTKQPNSKSINIDGNKSKEILREMPGSNVDLEKVFIKSEYSYNDPVTNLNVDNEDLKLRNQDNYEVEQTLIREKNTYKNSEDGTNMLMKNELSSETEKSYPTIESPQLNQVESTDKFRFECPVCLRQFQTRRCLKYHVSLRHRNDEVYYCTHNYCNKTFKSKFCFETHEKIFHAARYEYCRFVNKRF